eukprot:g3422.t1
MNRTKQKNRKRETSPSWKNSSLAAAALRRGAEFGLKAVERDYNRRVVSRSKGGQHRSPLRKNVVGQRSSPLRKGRSATQRSPVRKGGYSSSPLQKKRDKANVGLRRSPFRKAGGGIAWDNVRVREGKELSKRASAAVHDATAQFLRLSAKADDTKMVGDDEDLENELRISSRVQAADTPVADRHLFDYAVVEENLHREDALRGEVVPSKADRIEEKELKDLEMLNRSQEDSVQLLKMKMMSESKQRTEDLKALHNEIIQSEKALVHATADEKERSQELSMTALDKDMQKVLQTRIELTHAFGEKKVVAIQKEKEKLILPQVPQVVRSGQDDVLLSTSSDFPLLSFQLTPSREKSKEKKKWKREKCPESGRDYWLNEDTGEIVWEDPNLSTVKNEKVNISFGQLDKSASSFDSTNRLLNDISFSSSNFVPAVSEIAKDLDLNVEEKWQNKVVKEVEDHSSLNDSKDSRISEQTTTSNGSPCRIYDLCNEDKEKVKLLVEQLLRVGRQNDVMVEELRRSHAEYIQRESLLTAHNNGIAAENVALRKQYMDALKELDDITKNLLQREKIYKKKNVKSKKKLNQRPVYRHVNLEKILQLNESKDEIMEEKNNNENETQGKEERLENESTENAKESMISPSVEIGTAKTPGNKTFHQEILEPSPATPRTKRRDKRIDSRIQELQRERDHAVTHALEAATRAGRALSWDNFEKEEKKSTPAPPSPPAYMPETRSRRESIDPLPPPNVSKKNSERERMKEVIEEVDPKNIAITPPIPKKIISVSSSKSLKITPPKQRAVVPGTPKTAHAKALLELYITEHDGLLPSNPVALLQFAVKKDPHTLLTVNELEKVLRKRKEMSLGKIFRKRKEMSEGESQKDKVHTDKVHKKEEKWKHEICPTSGRDYWYNEETDESVWEDPNLSTVENEKLNAHFGQAETKEQGKRVYSSLQHNAAIKVQSTWRMHSIREEIRRNSSFEPFHIDNKESELSLVKLVDNIEAGDVFDEFPMDEVEKSNGEEVNGVKECQKNFLSQLDQEPRAEAAKNITDLINVFEDEETGLKKEEGKTDEETGFEKEKEKNDEETGFEKEEEKNDEETGFEKEEEKSKDMITKKKKKKKSFFKKLSSVLKLKGKDKKEEKNALRERLKKIDQSQEEEEEEEGDIDKGYLGNRLAAIEMAEAEISGESDVAEEQDEERELSMLTVDEKKWKHEICPVSGRDYWYNEETDESVWEDPNLSTILSPKAPPGVSPVLLPEKSRRESLKLPPPGDLTPSPFLPEELALKQLRDKNIQL